MAIRKINSRSIQDGQIATADLADDAITSGKIADSVTRCWIFPRRKW